MSRSKPRAAIQVAFLGEMSGPPMPTVEGGKLT
jgi:hypothetical protein